MNTLHNLIKRDLDRIGLKTDFNLDIRGFSKIYDGRYDPNTETVIVYVKNEYGELIDYNEIIDTVIHEAIHHLQWKHDPNFVRVKGVMHNQEFYRLYETFSARYKSKRDKGVIRIAETISKEKVNYIKSIKYAF